MNWNSAVLWGLIGIFSTIFFGFLFSYIFYRKGLKKKRLVCHRNSTALITHNISKYKDLKILYNNNEIQTLTSTSITLKNVGNDIINPDDIIPSDPIILKTSGHFLFSIDTVNNTLSEIYVSNPKVKVSLEYIDSSNLKLNFDFLPPKCELFITLLHSGDIEVMGDLKIGTFSNNIKKYPSELNRNNIFTLMRFFDTTMSFIIKSLYIFSILLLVILPLSIFVNKNVFTQDDIFSFLLLPLFGIFLIIFQIFEEKIFQLNNRKGKKDDNNNN